MKMFWKVFIVSLIFFIVAFSLGSYSYIKLDDEDIDFNIGGGKHEIEKPETFNSLEEAIKNSNRINIILLGMEDKRTDTILLGSFDPDDKKVDVISIPRDTYVHRKGYDYAEQRKINAVYRDHSVDGVKRSISYILEGIPIHHYIVLDYEGVEAIVDSIGGVEVEVPFHMKYTDPTSKPPLNIDIKEGKQVLHGKEALDFIRYRRSDNNMGYIDGDLGRIKAQQEFLKSFTKKALSYRLPVVIKKGFDYVETDIKLIDGLAYAKDGIGIKDKDFSFITLPGEGEFKKVNGKVLSYFTYNSFEIKELLQDTYKVKKTP